MTAWLSGAFRLFDLRTLLTLLLLTLTGPVRSQEFQVGGWKGYPSSNKDTGAAACVMVQALDDGTFFVVRLTRQLDFSVGLYNAAWTFSADYAPEAKILVDRSPPIMIVGKALSNDTVVFEPPQTGLLRSLFETGSVIRLEIGKNWAQLGLRGSKEAVQKLQACATSQISETPASLADKQNELWSSVSFDSARASAEVRYSGCEDNEECLELVIGCEKESAWTRHYFTIVSHPANRALARKLLDHPFRKAKMTFQLQSIAVEAVIESMNISTNEMNGEWDLELSSSDMSRVFGVMNSDTATSVEVQVEGFSRDLTVKSGDKEKLLQIQKLCAARN